MPVVYSRSRSKAYASMMALNVTLSISIADELFGKFIAGGRFLSRSFCKFPHTFEAQRSSPRY